MRQEWCHHRRHVPPVHSIAQSSQGGIRCSRRVMHNAPELHTRRQVRTRIDTVNGLKKCPTLLAALPEQPPDVDDSCASPHVRVVVGKADRCRHEEQHDNGVSDIPVDELDVESSRQLSWPHGSWFPEHITPPWC